MPRTSRHSRPFVRDDGHTELDVAFEFTPGTPESGSHGPPEDYDPGSGPEVFVLQATPAGHPEGFVATLSQAEEDRFRTELLEDPDFDPDPDSGS